MPAAQRYDRSGKELLSLAAARLAIEGVTPEIDAGRFAAKAVVGWPVEIGADVFGDGHEVFAAAVVMPDGSERRMTLDTNDRWTAEVTFDAIGPARIGIVAWRDLWQTWAHDTTKKVAANQTVTLEIEEAKALLERVKPLRDDRGAVKALIAAAKAKDIDTLLSRATSDLMARIGPRGNETRYPRDLPFWVDRERAAFSAWYELFPRSAGPEGQHGTFRDVIGRLPYVKDLGFDVLYFPPIHPIGKTNRKGKNNSLKAGAEDVGSPYAIGSDEGGMDALHPGLGSFEDFAALVEAAREVDIEIAIDIALNASPDHPWIAAHPDWFEWRLDGTIRHAENPPKKYEDIVNFRYYLDDGSPNAPFWRAISDLFLFWAERGVTCFRVDNPHTKPFPFWEWVIASVRARFPEAIFLSEAFTRPKVMKRLAKLGFNQSYTYYTWRNTKAELTEYLTELSTEECRDFMRPNFFTNTPDINPVFLQSSGRPGFRTRALMAGSLSGSFGIYSGFELCESAALPGREEYLDSEKYQIRHRDWDAPGHIKDDIRLINRLRRENPAMRDYRNIRFFNAFDDRVLYYGRFDDASRNYLLFQVMIDPLGLASFEFEVPLWEFGLSDDGIIEVEDAIHGNRFTWQGKAQLLTLDAVERPYAIWKLHPEGQPS